MFQEFLSDSSGSAHPNSASEMPQREPIRFMIIGSPEGVMEEIHKFYVDGFAQVDEWSPLTPVPNSDLFMTILIRYRQRLASDRSTRKSGR
ncbi:peptide ABC transporter substrate-binding protein [Microseira sp. BLCC-F43]|jgi:alkanesulfonate monooxygenase SsuD/methylene tetrahydromethanopterin reductase-like flavin-dependent oxidoreductase (luciferase family)|uniref:peptide ABC transporter substrate-binding protein n=1 Tax=Microseira sp. BLCC-F43 TaxID=3153602 RepID=UPI0035B709B5